MHGIFKEEREIIKGTAERPVGHWGKCIFGF
jgi:hypothetical protein